MDVGKVVADKDVYFEIRPGAGDAYCVGPGYMYSSLDGITWNLFWSSPLLAGWTTYSGTVHITDSFRYVRANTENCPVDGSTVILDTTVASPIADFIASPGTGTAPLTVSFTDLSLNSPTGWAWFFGDETYTQPWTQQTASAGWSIRQGHSSVAMPDGSIVLMGGSAAGYYNDVWGSMDDGATWMPMASPGWSPRQGHSSVAMPDGSIVLTGGEDSGGYYNDVWRSIDNGVTWTNITTSGGWTARGAHSSVVMPDGSIVLMGGYDGYSLLNDVWRSIDNGATWTRVNASAGWSARQYHSSVAMPDGSIVLMGGYDNIDPIKNDVWRSTDNGVTWTQVNASAGWSGRYGHSSVAMPDGSIVLMGGYASGYYNDVWRFIPAVSSAQNPSHIYTTAGNYSVALQAYNAGGYNSTRKTGYIKVSAPLNITAYPDLIHRGDQFVIDIQGLQDNATFSLLMEGNFTVMPGQRFNFETNNIQTPLSFENPLFAFETHGTNITSFTSKQGDTTISLAGHADINGTFTFPESEFPFQNGTIDYIIIGGRALTDTEFINAKFFFVGKKIGPSDSQISFNIDGFDNGIVRLIIFVDNQQALYKTVTIKNPPPAPTPIVTATVTPTPVPTTPPPIANIIPISYDQLINGTLNNTVQIGHYTFTGLAGDLIDARLDASWDYWPQLVLYWSNGTYITSASSNYGWYGTEIAYRLPENGSYILVVQDTYAMATGTYSLYLTRLNPPPSVTPIQTSQRVSGDFTRPLEMIAFNYFAQAGEKVRIWSYGSGLETRLYSSDGTAIFIQDPTTLTDPGTYYFVATHRPRTDNGPYVIYIESLTNPTMITPISYDQLINGTLNNTVQMDHYIFTGSAGDLIDARLDASWDYWPQLVLYWSNGTYIKSAPNYGWTGTEITYILPENGSYILVVRDSAMANTGTYSLSLTRLNPAPSIASFSVKITGISSINFPNISLYANVNTTSGESGILTQDNISLYENGMLQPINSVSFRSINTTTKADILFLFDDTGSMGGTIDGMKANVQNLTDLIVASGIDARYSLITFKDDTELDVPWTDNASEIKAAVDRLSAYGGGDGPEVNLDAIMLGISQGHRSEVQRIIIDITDAPTHFYNDGTPFSAYSIAEVENAITLNGITFIAVSPSNTDPADLRIIAEIVDGTWIDIYGGDFNSIMHYIGHVLTTTYTIEYTTLQPVSDGLERNIELFITDPVEGIGEDTGTYTAPTTSTIRAGFVATPVSGVAPLAVQFNDTSTGYPAIWNWSFGDGTFSAQQSPDHLYATAGNFTVTLKVSNGTLSDTLIKENYIVVNVHPPVASFAWTPPEPEVNTTITFNASASEDPDGYITTWDWSFGDGTNLLNQTTPDHTFKEPRVYNVTLTVTDNDAFTGTIVKQVSVYAKKETITTALNGTTESTVGGVQSLVVNATTIESTGGNVSHTNTSVTMTNTSEFWHNVEVRADIVNETSPGNITVDNVTEVVMQSAPITSALNATLGNVSVTLDVALRQYVQDAAIEVKVTQGANATTMHGFQLAANTTGNDIREIAYTVELSNTGLINTNLTTNGTRALQKAIITMSVSHTWVQTFDNGTNHEGRDEVKIIRIPESGTSAVLDTRFVRFDATTNLDLFEADSPDGLSLFGLVTLHAQAAAQSNQGTSPGGQTSGGTTGGGGTGGGTGGISGGYSSPSSFFTKTAIMQQSDEGKTLITNVISTGKEGSLTVPIGTIVLGKDGKPLSTISVEMSPEADVPAVPSGAVYTFGGYAVTCTPDRATFKPAVSLRFSLTADGWNALLAKANGNAGHLTIKFYDAASGGWGDVPTTVDPGAHSLTGSVSHFSNYGVFIDTTAMTSVVTEITPAVPEGPTTSEPGPGTTTPAVKMPVTAMTTDIGLIAWLLGIAKDNPVVTVVIIAIVGGVAYFGIWKRRIRI